jgi:spore germination protein YaaH
MFDRLSGQLLRIGLASALAISASSIVAAAAPATASAADQGSDTSIQHDEYLSHESEHYSFTPGGPATVSYAPRAGDTDIVDGAAPVALRATATLPGTTTPAAPSSSGPQPAGTINPLRREVFGFLPYWELGTTLDYDTLSTIAYFGVDVGSDGVLYHGGNGWAGWNSSSLTTVINDAHAHGTRVVLTAQSFAWGASEASTQSALLSSDTARLTAAQNIAAAVKSRGLDGVDLDFEPIASGQKANYVTFVRTLRAELDKVQPGYELTFCATGAPGTYDLPNLLADGAADAVFIMGYNLRGADPATAGSIDPLTSTLTRYSLSSVVNTYLKQVAPSKVILGVPWYGAAYSTATKNSLNAVVVSSTTYGKPVESYYSTLSGIAAMSDSTHLGKFYDPGEQTAWTAYYGTFGGQPTWREGYFDDARALGAKCDAIDGWNLRGVGIWALGYDNHNGVGDLTAEIAAEFETGVAGTTYHPLAPVRMVDTRKGLGISTKLLSGKPRTFQVTGVDGVDPTATAVTGNVTVVGETRSWAIYIGPYALSSPATSTINFKKGDVTANGLTIALSATGSLSATYMSTSGNTTDLVFDLTGYFTPDATGDTYHPIDPARVLDTRHSVGLKGKFVANAHRTFQVGGVGAVDAHATAVTGNLTVTNSTNGWAAFVGPDPIDKPTSSTINFKKGQVVANNLTVPLSATGTLSATFMSTKGSTTDLVFDVTGYYAADATGVRFVPITPARLLDSRIGVGLAGKIKANAPRTFQINSRVSLPANATAISGNVTVVNETGSWAVYVGPIQIVKPTTSTLNFRRGDVRANGLTVILGGNPGSLSVTYMSSAGNTTDLVLDVTGYYVP